MSCTGQGIKDIVRTPRPSCPPAVRLQKKWALEYGMPSTHAMVGMSIPFSVILYTMSRYQITCSCVSFFFRKYSVPLGVMFAVAWCTLICMSRLYLGMHSLLDIVVGIILALLLMIPVVPLVDSLDYYLLTNRWSPIILLTAGILLIIFYPSSDRWTPTRGDTTMIVSVCVGVHVGAWTNFHLGILSPSPDMPPYAVIWPTYAMLGLGTLRTILGFCCIVATRALCKSASYATLCALLRLNSRELKESRNSLHNREKIVVELSYTFITYFLVTLGGVKIGGRTALHNFGDAALALATEQKKTSLGWTCLLPYR
uniref:Phosphatidic acid phosphatase type 2/haloperoxidase domain-containing protein n=1 Tax=Timema douglasi TaxID=61478 RepID=A0A7R8ZCM1_TIMDO|nr:unnamed protein product [Timema douglasi]